MAARAKRDDEAWVGERPSRLALPVLILAALVSASLVIYTVGDRALAAGFAATVLAVAALLSWYRRLFPAELADREATPDWTVARAAADASNMAIAVTDRAGRLVCAGYRDSVPAQIRYWRTELGAVTAGGKAYVVGDVSGGALGGLPFAEVLEYEAEYERAVAQAFPVVTLCQYDARTISGLDAVGVLQCHHGPIRSAL